MAHAEHEKATAGVASKIACERITIAAPWVPDSALKNGYEVPFFVAPALTILTSCCFSFFARLAMPASCFLVLCFARLVFSI
jgi:hypothetical protein